MQSTDTNPVGRRWNPFGPGLSLRMTLLGYLLVPTASLSTMSLHAAELSVADYPSIQQALDANPGRVLYVPAGDFVVNEKLRIRADSSGLCGPGRIIQENQEQPIIEIEEARGVEIRDLTLTRPEGKWETSSEGILAIRCKDLVVDNVRVIDNRTRASAISLRQCQGSRISRCLVRNYMRVTIDDRTADPDWGFAFHCTDGTGILVGDCQGTLIEGNRVVEENLIPTPEIQTRYQLGEWAKKNASKGNFLSQQAWDREYSDNWQQGSALLVSGPEVSELTRILGNHIENAAQGIDLHCDHVIVANNIVANSFMGLKAMHGSRNVIIANNQFVKNDLWAIGMMPGASSHGGEDAARPANRDGGSIIANNIVSDFGHGQANWIWGNHRSPFKFDRGQEPDDPPLSDVLVQGNLVHCIGEPRYVFAVIIAGGPKAPRGIRFSNNLFAAGTRGVANQEIDP